MSKKINKKMIAVGWLLAIVAVAALVIFLQSQTQPIDTNAYAENQAYNALDQELSSAVQGISDSDVQNALT